MNLYTKDEVNYYIQEAYNMGKEDLADYLGEEYIDEDDNSVFNRVMQENKNTDYLINKYKPKSIDYLINKYNPKSNKNYVDYLVNKYNPKSIDYIINKYKDKN